MYKKTIIFGFCMLLLISSVSAFNYVFYNPDKQSFSITEIGSQLISYKEQLKTDKCLDKDDKWSNKVKNKLRPCIDKYYYLYNSYFWLYQYENV